MQIFYRVFDRDNMLAARVIYLVYNSCQRAALAAARCAGCNK